MLIRQYFAYNLSQRISAMPLLNTIQKLWLSFQLICGLRQIHKAKTYHGDINVDNVLVTSWNWLVISDFAQYKPNYLSSENLGQYQFFFVNKSEKNAGCYLAPEKFLPTKSDLPMMPLLEQIQAMDIFSAGCVIAEIFLDGQPLFDRPKLQDYKRKLYNPEELLDTIEFVEVKNLIMSMINLEPTERKSAKEYLKIMMEKIIPTSFLSFMYYFMGMMVHPMLTSSDKKIAMIFLHLDAIWKCCFNKSPASIDQSLNSTVFESIRSFPFTDAVFNIVPSKFPYCIDYKDIYSNTSKHILPIKIKQCKDEEIEKSLNAKSILIIVDLLGTLLRSCNYPSSKTCILAILTHIGLEVIFQIYYR